MTVFFFFITKCDNEILIILVLKVENIVYFEIMQTFSFSVFYDCL